MNQKGHSLPLHYYTSLTCLQYPTRPPAQSSFPLIIVVNPSHLIFCIIVISTSNSVYLHLLTLSFLLYQSAFVDLNGFPWYGIVSFPRKTTIIYLHNLHHQRQQKQHAVQRPQNIAPRRNCCWSDNIAHVLTSAVPHFCVCNGYNKLLILSIVLNIYTRNCLVLAPRAQLLF